ncbi:hypothetical protein [Frigoriglobus tundricola]|uniref:Carboxypeptidase regulatory-like domain-containing protein n=1 Tax=Frigoriglobus tundricola TaxID=2774151 RepID=A0A6M5YLY4_9BACT|nr:hypothetical protein [Frigoriglobus tundricola]QJW94935.1 hypothetical protein FTUN_2461 [Frigoriglobus tundricola]
MAGAYVQRGYWLLIGGLIPTLCALAGCGGSGTATVEGKVTLDGQPVSAGRVVFRSADGKNTAIAKIAPDGSYRVLDVPCDTMKVSVNPLDKLERIKLQREANGAKGKGARAPEARAQSGAAEAIESSVKIPEKYQDPDASGLTFTVKSGTNTYNIEIPSK